MIPICGWIDDIAAAILELIVDVIVAVLNVRTLDPSIAHRADWRPHSNQIALLHALGMGVQDLMGEAICILDGDSSHIALTCVCHDADHWRVEHWIALIDSRLPDGIIEIDTLM